jgi:hypothetical protein
MKRRQKKFLVIGFTALQMCSIGALFAEDAGVIVQRMDTNETRHSLAWKRSSQLQSRWAEELLKTTPLPEYPRPTLVRKDWLSLNGEWDFLGDGPVPPQLPDNFPDKALVPSSTEAITSCLDKNYERGWYRKTIQIPDGWGGKRVFLHCEAIGTKSTVYFDGTKLGDSEGGFERVSHELPTCTPGKTHQILIHFDDTDKRMPRGKLERLSGLWQTVWIEPVASDYIISFKQTPDIDASRLMLQVAASDPKLTVTVTARDQGKIVATAQGTGRESIDLQIPGQKLWTPENPFLYDLGIELKKDGVVIDRVDSYFGMRKISRGLVDGAPRILLNNNIYYQTGLLEHGRWPDSIFTQPSDECLKWEIQTAREMGFNTIRNHLKIECERWYYWCDKLGMLVWQDLPVPTFFSAYRPKSEDDKQIQRDTLRDMIVQRYNHPSIISWIIFNEGGAQFDPRQMTLLAKKLDTSRLINTTSHIWLTDEAKRQPGDSQSRFNTDYYDTHCYERTLKFYEANNSYIPAAFGEFGGIGYAVEGHAWQTPRKPWGYGPMAKSAEELMGEYEKLVKQAAAMRESDDLCAIIYTELIDHLDEVNGFITFDRKVLKVDVERMRKINDLFRNPPDQ